MYYLYIFFFSILNSLFFNYVNLIFKKLNDLLNTKYTKYTDSVRKHKCESTVMNISIQFFFFKFLNFIKFETQKGRSYCSAPK